MYFIGEFTVEIDSQVFNYYFDLAYVVIDVYWLDDASIFSFSSEHNCFCFLSVKRNLPFVAVAL